MNEFIMKLLKDSVLSTMGAIIGFNKYELGDLASMKESDLEKAIIAKYELKEPVYQEFPVELKSDGMKFVIKVPKVKINIAKKDPNHDCVLVLYVIKLKTGETHYKLSPLKSVYFPDGGENLVYTIY